MTNPHQREAVEREAREIINRHCEYMDGLERGQQWMRTSSALAAVKEALAKQEPTEAMRDRDEWREQHENLLAIYREQTATLYRRTELLRRTLAYLPRTLGIQRDIRDELPPANESTDEANAIAEALAKQTSEEPTEAMLDAAEAAYDREPPAIDAHRRGLAKAYLAMRSQQSEARND